MRRALIPLSLAVALALPAVRAQAAGGAIAAPIVFRPKGSTMLTLEGSGPYHGSLEVRRAGATLDVVDELDLDSYVMGVREVPGTWPMEALKAQAVAARTYVLWEIGRGYWKRFGFDVCGTTSCQVYQGAGAEQGERGRRWARAVRETAGQVLLYAGKPALTRYHASSGGRTLPGEVVFPSDGKLPYLRAVDDPYDVASPLHRWDVDFARRRLERILHDAIGLNGTITAVTVDEPARRMSIATRGGKLDMTTVRFRRVVSEFAPRDYPDLYPSARRDGQRLPFTLPSSRFSVSASPDGFAIHGRGYGHGVGLSQWGAYGRARHGQDYREILSAYYGGLRPQAWTGPRTIRVAVARGIGSVRISGDGPFGVYAAGRALSSSTLGGWVTAATGTRSIAVSPPEGYGLPIALTGISVPREHVFGPGPGHALAVGFVVPKPAEVTAVVSRAGREVARARTVVEAGERHVLVPLDAADLDGRSSYDVVLAAFDGTSTARASATVVIVKPGGGLLAKAGAGTAVALALLVLVLRRKPRGRAPAPDRGAASAPARRG